MFLQKLKSADRIARETDNDLPQVRSGPSYAEVPRERLYSRSTKVKPSRTTA